METKYYNQFAIITLATKRHTQWVQLLIVVGIVIILFDNIKLMVRIVKLGNIRITSLPQVSAVLMSNLRLLAIFEQFVETF